MSRPTLRRFCVILVPIFLWLNGCGSDEDITLAPVSGKVTLNGDPLPDATVKFAPQSDDLLAPTSYGKTNENGEFELKVISNEEPGAVPGQHKVSITLPYDDKLVDGEYVPDERQLPLIYNRDTKLTFEVDPGGNDDANFDLETE